MSDPRSYLPGWSVRAVITALVMLTFPTATAIGSTTQPPSHTGSSSEATKDKGVIVPGATETRDAGLGIPAEPSLNSAMVIAPPEKEPAGDSIAINFEGVDLMSLLRYLSQETGKGFIVDQGVSGTITIISPVRLTRLEALATLESILQVKGFAAIPSGRMFKIVPLAQAKVAGTETRRGSELKMLGDDDTLVTQILPIEKTSVEEARAILQPLLPPDASMLTFQPSNTLIITGRSVNIKRAMEVLSELEKGRVKAGLDIVSLQYSSPGYIKTQLETIMNTGGMARSEIRGSVTLVPDTRINSIMVISAPENFGIIRALITRLDTPSSDTRPEITRVYPLKYAEESETIKQIQDILSLSNRGREDPGALVGSETLAIQNTRFLAIKRTHSIMVSTHNPDIITKIEALLVELDSKSPIESASVRIVHIVNADAKMMADTLNKLVQDKAQGKTTKKPDEISFAADSHTNSLIITGRAEIFAPYERVLKALDIMRPQILVEALIAEVSGNLSKSMGIEWGAIDPNSSAWRAFGGTNFGMRATAETTQGMQIGLVKDPLDLQKLKDGDINEVSKIRAIIGLYQNNSNFNILSAPRILSTDNEEAKIMVGEVVPLPQGFTKDTVSGRFDLTNFKYEDVGVNLTLTPRVNSNKLVTLKLNQEVKKRQEENLYQFSVPILTKRMMTTTVTVPNGETIVIGGLVREDKTEVEDRIPFFSNLPLIGKTFRNKRNTTQKTNLLVFLTPHILSTPEQVARFDDPETGPVATTTKKLPGSPQKSSRISRKSSEIDRVNVVSDQRMSDIRSRVDKAFQVMSIGGLPCGDAVNETTKPAATPHLSSEKDLENAVALDSQPKVEGRGVK
ncbi:MAG: hypothetical protein HQM09_01785 [Candidatus Riflebacteria bacterium]|nr:hypothetical protein [Candidatus Riflebacteria bacterium]